MSRETGYADFDWFSQIVGNAKKTERNKSHHPSFSIERNVRANGVAGNPIKEICRKV